MVIYINFEILHKKKNRYKIQTQNGEVRALALRVVIIIIQSCRQPKCYNTYTYNINAV